MDQQTFDAFSEAILTAAETEDPAKRSQLVASVLAGLGLQLQGQGQAEKPAYFIPGPYDIAMQFGAAAVASGRYENIGAAMTAAWAAIPEFYQARDFYTNEVAPAFFGVAAEIQAARQAAEGNA